MPLYNETVISLNADRTLQYTNIEGGADGNRTGHVTHAHDVSGAIYKIVHPSQVPATPTSKIPHLVVDAIEGQKIRGFVYHSRTGHANGEQLVTASIVRAETADNKEIAVFGADTESGRPKGLRGFLTDKTPHKL